MRILRTVLGAGAVLAWLMVSGAAHAEAQWIAGGGRASIHRASSTGGFGLLGYSRALDGVGRLRLGGMAVLGTADEGYLALEVAGGLHPVPDARLSPFAELHAGALGESEFVGTVLGVMVGADLRVAPTLHLRVAASWARHGGTDGPNALLVALRLGRR